MNRLLRTTQLIGLNSVPVAGVLLGGWSNATALVLYLCENVIMALLMAVRIYAHRKATNKRGHYIEVEVTTYGVGDSSPKMKTGHFGSNFLLAALVFSIAQGCFLGLILDHAGSVDPEGLETGLGASAALLLAGLALDMVGLRERSFAWIRQMANAALWRVFVVNIALIIGIIGAQFLGLPRTGLVAFAGLKLFSDIAYQLPQYDAADAPGWSARLFSRNYAEEFRAQRIEDLKRAAEDEETFAGKRSRTPAFVNITKGTRR